MPTFAWRLIPCLLVASLAFLFWNVPGVPAADVRYLRIGVGPANSPGYGAGTALVSTISRPPGLPPCAAGQACGVPGVIALAQSLPEDGIVAAVARGDVDTGLVPAQAVFGARCPVDARTEAVTVTVIADIYNEALHVLARPDQGIVGIPDLRGKRVAIGRPGTEERRLADRILMAHDLRRADIRMVQLSGAEAVEAFRAGEVDALFLIAAWPDPTVSGLAADGQAVLVPVAGEGADRLRSLHPFAGAGRIPDGTYGETGEVETLLQPVVWIAGPGLADEVTADLATAVTTPANRAVLRRMEAGLDLAVAVAPTLPAPLHPGAARVYGGDAKVLACPGG